MHNRTERILLQALLRDQVTAPRIHLNTIHEGTVYEGHRREIRFVHRTIDARDSASWMLYICDTMMPAKSATQ